MDEQLTTQQNNIDQSNSSSELENQDELQVNFDHPLRGEGSERLLEIWNQINSESDPTTLTAMLLTGVHYFGYALTLSNSVNGRQGKNRVTFNNEQRKLMDYSLDENVDTFVDTKLNDLFIYILNTYLLDKQELPENKPKKQKAIDGKVKTLFIMIFATGQYGVINKLNVPIFVQPMIQKVFEFLDTKQDEILNQWISYLELNESDEIADVVRSLGSQFWGSEYMTAPNIFVSRFQGLTHKFKNYQETYNKYLEYRAQYLEVSRNIARNSLTPIFNLSNDQYDYYRTTILNEFQQIFSEDENALAIQKLIYEY